MNNGEPIPFEDTLQKAAFLLDEPAFESFFKQNFVSCCAFCRTKFGFDTDLAKEVVHAAFIKLWETRQRLTNSVTMRSYLLRIIINHSLDLIKQEKTRQQYTKFFLETNREGFEEKESVDYKQLAAAVQNAIVGLPAQMRTIFELSRYEGLKYSAIAAQLNISTKTVETQMSRALVKLREKLHRYLLLFMATMILSKFL